jgi:hypothetical protein
MTMSRGDPDCTKLMPNSVPQNFVICRQITRPVMT